ncbi:cytochrome c oxidase subunit 3 [Stutzerimonas tarimensis]|uniref:cytochrome-c oxidase n=1 Tax=Stutzerimonas tarimensis TaxID=1507735 RepID=A0ABV7T1R4_9GAMM
MTTPPHENYYVPERSHWPIVASISLLILVAGLATWLNDLTANRDRILGPAIFFVGAMFVAWMLFGWFGSVVREARAGLYSAQMDRSFRWTMGWFIFSEVMLFAALFGALFYIRYWVGPWLAGEGEKGMSNLLWPGFEYSWPLLENPDPRRFPSPAGVINPWTLPLLNTVLLVSSSLTLTLAHHALKKDRRGSLKAWLGLTLVLGAVFLTLQGLEYLHAYRDLGLTLGSGIYGATFFMLTGFHGAHVTLGAIILLVMFIRILRGHFTPQQHFGFEAAAWYWHFVDVVWIGLFVFVYVI